MKHLAIFQEGVEGLIFAGKKTIEARLSKKKVSPFGQVSAGDIVYIKPAGKDIVGQFKVTKVISFDGLDLSDLTYLSNLGIENIPEGAKFATLIFIGQVEQFITPPIKVSKKDHRSWMVLTD